MFVYIWLTLSLFCAGNPFTSVDWLRTYTETTYTGTSGLLKGYDVEGLTLVDPEVLTASWCDTHSFTEDILSLTLSGNDTTLVYGTPTLVYPGGGSGGNGGSGGLEDEDDDQAEEEDGGVGGPRGVNIIQIQFDNPYRYGGKELLDVSGLDLYDFGARQYAPALPRWLTMDPLAEKYYRISPYAHRFGNPIRYCDPDGGDGWDTTMGYVIGGITNVVLGSSGLRDRYRPHDSADYNSALKNSDRAAAIGEDMVAGGRWMMKGGAVPEPEIRRESRCALGVAEWHGEPRREAKMPRETAR